jgi:menaquinone-dependent protoporphyrinogen IX oxidase
VKTLVLYDGRHGFTEKCLGLLARESAAELDLWPIRYRRGVPSWEGYQCVVFGGPVYFGRWSPPLTKFLKKHAAGLTKVPSVAAFVVSLSPKAAALNYYRQTLPAAYQDRAALVACFGGGIEWKALTWWERWMVKAARGVETDVSNLNLAEIQALAAWLSALPGQDLAP